MTHFEKASHPVRNVIAAGTVLWFCATFALWGAGVWSTPLFWNTAGPAMQVIGSLWLASGALFRKGELTELRHNQGSDAAESATRQAALTTHRAFLLGGVYIALGGAIQIGCTILAAFHVAGF